MPRATYPVLLFPSCLPAESRCALVHNSEKARALSDKGVDTIIGDMDNPAILNKAFDGAAAKKDVRDSGPPVAFFRPHYFMQNIFGSLQTIAAEGVFYQGTGDGKLAMIDVRDIADSAARVLLERSHAGKTCTLTDPAGRGGGRHPYDGLGRFRHRRHSDAHGTPGPGDRTVRQGGHGPRPVQEIRQGCSSGQPLIGQSVGSLCMVHGLHPVHARGRMG